MTEENIEMPTYPALIWPTVLAFRELDGSADKKQLLATLQKLMDLSDDVMKIPHGKGPQTEFAYRVAWVQTWLKQAGILENPKRGMWVLTPLGREVSQQEAESIGPTRNIARGQADELGRSGQEEPSDSTSWQGELIEIIKGIHPKAFERLTKQVLLKSGFSDVVVTGRPGDRGVDAVGTVSVNNVLTFRVIVQCKRYSESVGPGDIREFRGAMQGRSDKGIFVTTGTFTVGAEEEAQRDGAPTIDLIDGEGFATLLKQINLGVKTEMVEKVSVVKEFFADI